MSGIKVREHVYCDTHVFDIKVHQVAYAFDLNLT